MMDVKKFLTVVVQNKALNCSVARRNCMILVENEALAVGVNSGTTREYGLNFWEYLFLGEVATLCKPHMWNLLRPRDDFALSFREFN